MQLSFTSAGAALQLMDSPLLALDARLAQGLNLSMPAPATAKVAAQLTATPPGEHAAGYDICRRKGYTCCKSVDEGACL